MKYLLWSCWFLDFCTCLKFMFFFYSGLPPAPSIGASVFGLSERTGLPATADLLESNAMDMSINAIYLHQMHHRWGSCWSVIHKKLKKNELKFFIYFYFNFLKIKAQICFRTMHRRGMSSLGPSEPQRPPGGSLYSQERTPLLRPPSHLSWQRWINLQPFIRYLKFQGWLYDAVGLRSQNVKKRWAKYVKKTK